MPEFTQLLEAAARGDRHASADLLPLVYEELRQLAAARVTREAANHTLNATALVHEAYLRLVGEANSSGWQSRGHFFAAAAEAMRRILIDHARRKKRLRHGGDRHRVSLSENHSTNPNPNEDDLLAVDEVLDQLTAHDPEVAELVKLHVFAGLTLEQVAELQGISARTAYRNWSYARAWMFRELKK